jgi:hypothetical protein
VVTALAPLIFKLDLNLKQGVGGSINLGIVDATGQIITNPSGYAIRAQIRRTRFDSVLFEWSSTPASGQGTAILNYVPGSPPSSTVALILTGAESAVFPFRIAKWDVFLIDPIGRATCLAEGDVRVDPYITH